MPPPPPPPGLPRRGKMPPAAPPPAADDRGALLASIRAGANLKKTVTNDRSTPVTGAGKNKPSNGGVFTPVCSGSNAIGGGGGSGLMNGGAPQLGGLFAGGIPKLRPTGRPSPSPLSSDSLGGATLMPPGRKPVIPGLSTPSSYSSSLSSNESIPSVPASPKPSNKSNPAPPPPPPSDSKPSLSSSTYNRFTSNSDLPLLSSKPAPPRPPSDISPTLPGRQAPALPAKPSFVSRPSVGNKPAPPIPPSTLKPKLLLPSYEDHDRAPGRPPNRAQSMRVNRSSSDMDGISHNSPGAAEAPPFSYPSKTVPQASFRAAKEVNSYRTNFQNGSRTVGRVSGTAMNRPWTKPPLEKPPPPPARPQVPAPPPPSQPPPPPPHKTLPHSSSHVESIHDSIPPPPPVRQSSIAPPISEFESKFHNMFQPLHHLPDPRPYTGCTKSYPSQNARPASQRRAPPPPPNQHLSSTSFLHSSHTAPPPPPPHAPLHVQVGAKMYGTEASQC